MDLSQICRTSSRQYCNADTNISHNFRWVLYLNTALFRGLKQRDNEFRHDQKTAAKSDL